MAVANKLKDAEPAAKIVYIGQRGDDFADIVADSSYIDAVYGVSAGKFRRFYGEGIRQVLHVPTMLKNLRDVFRVIAGIWQARQLLKVLQPDVVFIKGGFVGVPVGLAAANLKIPYITHDSDALPGLANRIIGRWASIHAVALPKEVYQYLPSKTVTVGVPIVADYRRVTGELQAVYRKQIGLPVQGRLLFIIGGGLGAQRINLAVVEALPHLLQEFPDLQVVHAVGKANEAMIQKLYTTNLSTAEQGRVSVKGYLTDAYLYSGAADVIITRAGATQLAEFAMQAKPCVIIPNPVLTGGHQLKNAQYLQQKQAAVLVSEAELQENPIVLAARVSALFKGTKSMRELSANLATFAQPDAAQKLAKLILMQVSKTSGSNAI
ncbi:MAG TPA: glycosyltransferase [Patescibacteria group bacterium]|nr:glycosyltransferase [Patescibacteria group bacterium]